MPLQTNIELLNQISNESRNPIILIPYADKLEKLDLKQLLPDLSKIIYEQHQEYFHHIKTNHLNLLLVRVGIKFERDGLGLSWYNKFVKDKNIQYIVNYGSTGALYKHKEGDVVIPKKIISQKVIKGINFLHPFLRLIENPDPLAKVMYYSLNHVHSTLKTNDEFVTKNEQHYHEFSDPEIVDMEAFNLGLIAREISLNNRLTTNRNKLVSFVSVKYVSDEVGSNSDLSVVNQKIEKYKENVIAPLKSLFTKIAEFNKSRSY